jgi:hypothetical protein
MISKKRLQEKCQDLQIQISMLQEQINELKRDQTFVLEVVDSSDEPVFNLFNQGGYSIKEKRTSDKTLKYVVQVLMNYLGVEPKVIESQLEVVMKKKSKGRKRGIIIGS